MTTTSRITPEQTLVATVFGQDEVPVFGPGIILTRAQRAERIAWEVSTTIEPGLSNTQLRHRCREIAKFDGNEVAHALWLRLGLNEWASPYGNDYIDSDELKCSVHSISYDFATKTGVLHLDDGNCCDMDGCTALFERISPDVERIETYAGKEPDTFYTKTKLGWVAA